MISLGRTLGALLAYGAMTALMIAVLAGLVWAWQLSPLLSIGGAAMFIVVASIAQSRTFANRDPNDRSGPLL